jgi:hypothetical protein
MGRSLCQSNDPPYLTKLFLISIRNQLTFAFGSSNLVVSASHFPLPAHRAARRPPNNRFIDAQALRATSRTGPSLLQQQPETIHVQ